MARPTIFDRPLTAAERMRLYRARKKVGAPQPPTARERARRQGQSLRYYYYAQAFFLHSVMAWDQEFISNYVGGTYGRIGLEFLVEVGKHGSVEEQRAVCERIKQAGAAAGRALWRELVLGKPDLQRRHEERHRRRKLGRRRWRENPHVGMVW